MTRLAAAGHTVLYVEPPRWITGQIAKLTLGVRREQRPSQWFRRLMCAEQRGANLHILSLIRYLPTRSRSLRRLNYRLNLPVLRANIRRLGLKGATLWIYTPDAVAYAGHLGENLVCYDCVDEYAEQPYYTTNFEGIRYDEEELLRRAHVVITSARSLYEAKCQINPNTHLVRNVGDFEHFHRALLPDIPMSPELAPLPRPRIGFVGALDRYKLDIDVLTYTAQQRPMWSLVLIGPRGAAERPAALSGLLEQPNVHWLGPKPYAELPGYIKGFDVCIIPYVSNDYTRNCFPLKFFEFLASGKPVVVSGLPELNEYKGLIEIADAPESFVRSIEETLRDENAARREARLAVARINTWDTKVERLVNIVHQTIVEQEGMAAL